MSLLMPTMIPLLWLLVRSKRSQRWEKELQNEPFGLTPEDAVKVAAALVHDLSDALPKYPEVRSSLM